MIGCSYASATVQLCYKHDTLNITCSTSGSNTCISLYKIHPTSPEAKVVYGRFQGRFLTDKFDIILFTFISKLK